MSCGVLYFIIGWSSFRKCDSLEVKEILNMEREYKTLETEFYRYTGETLNDIPDGKGRMEYLGDDYFFSYEGEFKEGKENGHGHQVTLDGTIDCSFVNGDPKGNGIYVFANGDRYIGPIDGVPEGIGRIEYDNGDVFEGMFKGGFANGEGTMTYLDGTVQKGIFSEHECIEEME